MQHERRDFCFTSTIATGRKAQKEWVSKNQEDGNLPINSRKTDSLENQKSSFHGQGEWILKQPPCSSNRMSMECRSVLHGEEETSSIMISFPSNNTHSLVSFHCTPRSLNDSLCFKIGAWKWRLLQAEPYFFTTHIQHGTGDAIYQKAQ